jgi:hypothetical protein
MAEKDNEIHLFDGEKLARWGKMTEEEKDQTLQEIIDNLKTHVIKPKDAPSAEG